MQTKTSQTDTTAEFDAVAESRRWKQAVAEATSGMSITERMAWFRLQSSVTAIRDKARPARRVNTRA